MITDAEILELEELLREKEIDLLFKSLNEYNDKTSPNYKFLKESFESQKYKGEKLVNGYRGVILEGSSRSSKTWSGVDFIIYLCTQVESNCTINIYRETYNEFKTTLYDDFKRRLDHFGLDNPFHRAKEIKSFKINGNTIYFLGDGKHGGGCDYAFYNEMMFINQSVFDQSEMRCRKFWWGDYNPSVTEHWVFDKVIPRNDVGFLRTTFRDNAYISVQEKAKILSYEPWETGSYDVVDDEVIYNGKLLSKDNYPPPHIKNIESGTADEYMWKVYGLGLRGAMKGVIFKNVNWIEEFPDIGFTYGNDFGFTNDPNALVKYSENETDIFIEPLGYEPIETPGDLDSFFTAIGMNKDLPITCDSSDKYTGENKGTVEMVVGLRKLGWKAGKVSKTKSVMFWLNSMREKRINIVKNHLYRQIKKERENYRFKEINGIAINQPIDAFNHFWDAARYCHIDWNKENKTYNTTESLSELGIAY